MSGSKTTKSITVDWQEFLGVKPTVDVKPEGYYTAVEIADMIGCSETKMRVILKKLEVNNEIETLLLKTSYIPATIFKIPKGWKK